MKKPFIIDMTKAMTSLEKYKQSEAYQAKLNEVKKQYERDKLWLDPILSKNNQKA